MRSRYDSGLAARPLRVLTLFVVAVAVWGST